VKLVTVKHQVVMVTGKLVIWEMVDRWLFTRAMLTSDISVCVCVCVCV